MSERIVPLVSQRLQHMRKPLGDAPQSDNMTCVVVRVEDDGAGV